jgi:5'-3' exonuclease
MAFDMHQWVYQAFHRHGGDATKALRDVQVLSHTLRHLAIRGIFVFDGDTSGLKPRAHRQRTEASAAALKAVEHEKQVLVCTVFETLEDFCEAAHAFERRKAQASKPPPSLFRDMKAALEALGSVIVAEDDAERLVAFMAKDGRANHAVSKDYDTLVFGAPEVVLEFPFYAGEDDGAEATVLVLDAVLAGLQLDSLSQLQDVAILAGCDYTEKIPGIGPAIAHRLIRAHRTIEGVLATDAIRVKVPMEFSAPFARARFRGEVPEGFGDAVGAASAASAAGAVTASAASAAAASAAGAVTASTASTASAASTASTAAAAAEAAEAAAEAASAASAASACLTARSPCS